MFTPDTLKFLRALKRNNDRDWFRANKDRYETHVKGPMLAVIERLARDLPAFAPEIVASPKTSLYRPYRDTRFSEDKTPLKIQVSASFRWRGLAKGEGAGLYLEVHPGWVWMGGGFWAPPQPALVRIREQIAESWPEIDRIVRARAFRRVLGDLEGERLTRVPRGFPADHPAAEYPEVQAVSRRPRVPAGVRRQHEVLPRPDRDLQGDHAAGQEAQHTCDVLSATCYVRTCGVLRATCTCDVLRECDVPRATCCVLTCEVLRAACTCDVLRACEVLRAGCYVRRASCEVRRVRTPRERSPSHVHVAPRTRVARRTCT